MILIEPSTQTSSICIEAYVPARVLNDIVIGRRYSIYTNPKRPWLLVKSLDGYVEFGCLYVGISTIVLASFVENVEMHFYAWSMSINCTL